MSKSGSTKPIVLFFELINRRWALRILWELRNGEPLGFREIQARCGNLSPSVLSRRLKELLEAGILSQDESSCWQVTPLGNNISVHLKAMSKLASKLKF